MFVICFKAQTKFNESVFQNMFLAIVNETYAEVKSEEIEDKSYLWLYLAKIFKKCKCCKQEEEHTIRKERKEPVKETPHSEKRTGGSRHIVDNFFSIVEQNDSEEFRRLVKRVAVIEGSIEKLHERLDVLIVRMKQRLKGKKKIEK